MKVNKQHCIHSRALIRKWERPGKEQWRKRRKSGLGGGPETYHRQQSPLRSWKRALADQNTCSETRAYMWLWIRAGCPKASFLRNRQWKGREPHPCRGDWRLQKELRGESSLANAKPWIPFLVPKSEGIKEEGKAEGVGLLGSWIINHHLNNLLRQKTIQMLQAANGMLRVTGRARGIPQLVLGDPIEKPGMVVCICDSNSRRKKMKDACSMLASQPG